MRPCGKKSHHLKDQHDDLQEKGKNTMNTEVYSQDLREYESSLPTLKDYAGKLFDLLFFFYFAYKLTKCASLMPSFRSYVMLTYLYHYN